MRGLVPVALEKENPLVFSGLTWDWAERTRFELVVGIAPYVGLANRWFQPLTHLSLAVRAGG